MIAGGFRRGGRDVRRRHERGLHAACGAAAAASTTGSGVSHHSSRPALERFGAARGVSLAGARNKFALIDEDIMASALFLPPFLALLRFIW